MKKSLILLFCYFSLLTSQTIPFVPRANNEGAVGTSGLHFGFGFFRGLHGDTLYWTTMSPAITASSLGAVTGTPWTSMGYVTGTPWTGMGYVTGTPWASMGYLTSYTETDPNVYTWAKASVKPTYTYTEVGAQATLVSATNIKTVNGNSLLGSGDIAISGGAGLGYVINVMALTSSPVDAQTVYFGMMPKAPITTANVSKVYIRKAGTLKIAEIYCYSGTAGTGEAWSLYVRKNNTTDYLIATLSVTTSERVFTNSALSITLVAGDYIELKSIQPTWVTNPLTTIYGGYLYIE
jgi:hypothetical protein